MMNKFLRGQIIAASGGRVQR